MPSVSVWHCRAKQNSGGGVRVCPRRQRGTLLGSGQWRKVQLTSASVWATGFLQPRGETLPGALDQRKSGTAELRAGEVAGVSIRVLWQGAGQRTGQRFARDLR